MQVVILCGGKGTRLGEVTDNRIPKPMATVGEHPILWHIMRSYARAGHTRFVLCAGHLSWAIKSYFLNYRARAADVTVHTGSGEVTLHETPETAGIPSPTTNATVDATTDNWDVTIAETGPDTQTAGRLARVMRHIEGDTFMLTYGDGVSDIDLAALARFHASHGKAITVSGVVPPGRFGELVLDGDKVMEMAEKPAQTDRYINGGFMVIDRAFVERFIGADADEVMLERAPMAEAAAAGEMMLYKHDGFWQCMDTMRDYELLNGLWRAGNAPWA